MCVKQPLARHPALAHHPASHTALRILLIRSPCTYVGPSVIQDVGFGPRPIWRTAFTLYRVRCFAILVAFSCVRIHFLCALLSFVQYYEPARAIQHFDGAGTTCGSIRTPTLSNKAQTLDKSSSNLCLCIVSLQQTGSLISYTHNA